jgi:hypothetical protein
MPVGLGAWAVAARKCERSRRRLRAGGVLLMAKPAGAAIRVGQAWSLIL